MTAPTPAQAFGRIPYAQTTRAAQETVRQRRDRIKAEEAQKIQPVAYGTAPSFIPAILERHGNGETITDICAEPGMPSRPRVMELLRAPEHRDALVRAREWFAEALADETLRLIRGCTEDNYNATRVKLVGMQWLAGVMDRKRFGRDVTPQAEPASPLEQLGEALVLERIRELSARVMARAEIAGVGVTIEGESKRQDQGPEQC